MENERPSYLGFCPTCYSKFLGTLVEIRISAGSGNTDNSLQESLSGNFSGNFQLRGTHDPIARSRCLFTCVP